MDEVKISPLARRLAEENSIDWRQIHGSGPEGRIVERDILTYLAKVMAGEISAPNQPDVSEPPPIDGVDPHNLDGMMGASAALAKEGVDLGALMSDHKTSAPAQVPQLQTQAPVQPVPVTENRIVDNKEDIFELDMDLEDPTPLVQTPAVQAQPDFVNLNIQPAGPGTSITGDVELVTDEIDLPTPHISNSDSFQLDDLEFESPVETHTPAPIAAQIVQPVVPVQPVPVTPVQPVPVVAVPVAPVQQISIPDPSPVVVQPIFTPPAPAAIIQEEASPPAAPPPSIAPNVMQQDMAAVSTTPFTPVAQNKIAPEIKEPTPLAKTPHKQQTGVIADYFSQTVLRRSFNAEHLLAAQHQLKALGLDAPLLAFVARSAKRNLKKLDLSNLSVAKLGDNGLLPIATPQLDGSFKDLLTNVEQASPGNAADLAVLDASALGLDDLVLPGIDLLLSLGRFDEKRGSLALSGSGVSARQGAAFLQGVAEMLEQPIGLIL